MPLWGFGPNGPNMEEILAAGGRPSKARRFEGGYAGGYYLNLEEGGDMYYC